MRKITAIAILLLMPILVLADEPTTPPSLQQSAEQILSGLVPFLIVFGLLYWVFQRQRKRTYHLMDKEAKHIDVVEEQNRRIIALLEEIRDLSSTSQVKRPSTPPEFPK